jgi:hypothetical protein
MPNGFRLIQRCDMWLVGGRATEHTAASTSQMGRFETGVLTQPKNLKALTKLSRSWIDRL